ncbi:MAG: efflux RND transporter periplasmic adaptor subunit [Candidatus Omnitrophica bacterium]|nr:efflux RND transporter periplasmic adaptor subunit [Candidatus Omnitrophota bacterium]
MIKKIISAIIVIVLVVAAVVLVKSRFKKDSGEITQEISPAFGTIQNTISTTGTVLPKNRLEIKPPVGGRVESILVKEGEKVKDGQTLAWMSSTERAALLDAAQGQGEAKLKYWEEAYKPIALLASIDGEVIVSKTQPGQTVTTADAVVVLSDQLIVRAQVDETDIGKVKVGQNAVVNLDAYPDTKIKAIVEHMYYESKTVNNVTIYEVDLIPEEVPPFFRSGMNTTINFIQDSREKILLIPLEALHKDKDESFVLLKNNGDKGPVKRVIKTGINDDKNIEIISGVEEKDTITVKSKKYVLPQDNSAGSNPFMPFGKKKETKR